MDNTSGVAYGPRQPLGIFDGIKRINRIGDGEVGVGVLLRSAKGRDRPGGAGLPQLEEGREG